MKSKIYLMALVLISCAKSRNENNVPDQESNIPNKETTIGEKENTIPKAVVPTTNSIKLDKKAVVEEKNKSFENARFRNVTVQKLGQNNFQIQGEAQIFEANFSWVLMAGEKELKNGFEMTDAGAPEWGKFNFKMQVPTTNLKTDIKLIVFEASAKDGSRQYELALPLE